MDINKDILRWALLLAAMPIWLPFLRLLWKDFNRALEEEGGVFGRPPTAAEAERIRREKLSDPDILVSEAWARPGQQRAPRMRSPGPGGSGPGGSGKRPRGAAGPPRPSGSGPGTADGKSGFRTNPRRGGEGGGGFR